MIDTKDYIKYIKSQFCGVCGTSPVDPDHLETIGMGNSRKKPSLKDLSCVPLCRVHHTERHQLGIKRFNELYRIDLWKDAFVLLRRYFCE